MASSKENIPTPSSKVGNAPPPTLSEILQARSLECGAHDRWIDLLKTRLVECGWREKVKQLCRQELCKHENIKVDDLAASIIPLASDMIPDEVKDEIRETIAAHYAQEVATIRNNE